MIKNFDDFRGWLNLTQSTIIKDNEFTVAKNVFYNNSKQLQTRRWYRKFGDPLGSAPATSIFFFQRDDNLDRLLVAHAWWVFYKYDNTSAFSVVYSNNIEYETRTGETTKRTRWDYAVYKNVIYMGDWVNPYASYDGTTHTIINTTSIWTTTADNTTDFFTKVAHWMSNNDEVYFTTSWTIPSGITEYQVYYVVNKTNDTWQVSTTKWWSPVTFTTNWTGTLTTIKLNEPRCRYISYLADSLVWAWDDANPSTLYYTDAAPSDWTNINQNFLVIGWDEAGKINALSEYNQLPIVFKDQKIYTATLTDPPTHEAIDAQTGWYSDRVIHSVGNTLVYFNERWIDTLTKRSWVGDTSGIESQPISDNVRAIFENVSERQYNANCWRYIKKINNYYVTVDTDNDNIPDTTLVYNSLVWSWTQYVFPPIYDYGYYINDDNQYQFLFSHWSWGQLYEFEYGFDDDWVDIEVEIQSKNFDFGDPAQIKSFGFMDFVGYKQAWWVIDISILVDWETASLWQVTDDNINIDDETWAIWVNPIGVDPLWSISGDTESDLLLYPFRVRVQLFERWENIAFKLQSTWVQWILEKARVDVNWEPKEVFYYDNIL